MGSAVGRGADLKFRPLIGAFVVVGKGWRWTQWTIVFFVVAFLSPIVFVRESYKKTILQRRERQLGVDANIAPKRTVSDGIRYFLTKTIIRPVHMLTTEPIVGLVCLYTSFQFALLYTFVVASPWIFETIYGFDLGTQGLTFLGFIVGAMLSPALIIAVDRKIYQRRLRQFESDNENVVEFPPEHRLYTGMIGSLILPTGLFAFAWTARPSLHWIVPIVFQAVTIFGSIQVYVSASLYMVDTYGPLYGASAAGASSLSRYTLSTAFPLFTLQMYKRLGVGWATSLLALAAAGMAPIPWIFYRWGPRLRSRSKYERST
jgi:MFS transporter, DHA1 family, multidrug resistance protein